MDYTPHTAEDVSQMLETIGVATIDELFEPVPANLRLGRPLDLPTGLPESEIATLMARLSAKNRPSEQLVCFAGGGAYDHYVPACVRSVAYRSEFVTSYTPYQPELSQGVLGAIFEYQSMICEITGMDVANASLYDGASALVEAVNLATAATGRKKVVVTAALNPNYRQVLETFGAGLGYAFVTASCESGVTEPSSLDDAACFIVSQPNFFGCIEDLRAMSEAAHAAGALLIVHYDPLSAGILQSPGALGADVVTGEGQSLGNDLNFGGPYLGIFATKMEHVRRVPGRICGETVDVNGKTGYVLTLQAREQHIRREKANSNVCTNQTLMAVVATVYLSWLGPQGMRELADTCSARAQYASQILADVPGCSIAFDRPFFKEFVLRVPGDSEHVLSRLSDRGYLAGPSLRSMGMDDCMLVAVSEKRSVEEIESLAKILSEVVA